MKLEVGTYAVSSDKDGITPEALINNIMDTLNNLGHPAHIQDEKIYNSVLFWVHSMLNAVGYERMRSELDAMYAQYPDIKSAVFRHTNKDIFGDFHYEA